jgi:hypothetical protein
VLKATARSVLNKPYQVAVGVFDPGDQLPSSDADPDRQREVVEAFLAASREGDFEALLTILDERVMLRANDAAVRAGASREVRRRAGSRRHVLGRARAARFALVDGAPGAVWAPDGRADGRASCSPSRSRPAGSSRSTYSPSPSTWVESGTRDYELGVAGYVTFPNAEFLIHNSID